MWANIQAPLFFGLIAAFVTSFGLIVVAQKGYWSERHASLFALAAGGMLLTLTITHIAPEAIERSSQSGYLILGGFMVGLVINFVVTAVFGDDDTRTSRASAATPVIAIAIHSFLDGIIYSVTFAASFEAGVFTALSLILHEFPEGVIAFTILRRFGFSNRQSFTYAFLAAAATTPLGVVASGPFVFSLGAQMVGNLFAISAGLLLFVATGPLIMSPLKSQPKLRSLGALGAGIGLALLITLSPLNGHRDAHGSHAPALYHAQFFETPNKSAAL